ncbi:hypothetical protein HW555_009427 [Spodoptera exigua]|uniref:Uncharacterized protein n=1 Tax=Spodoptera exigua TaxID=7107 RepID=A0A835GCH6_SPOEX|nr:hypothetical protein HW555_009427 [Spodoptera exigua]
MAFVIRYYSQYRSNFVDFRSLLFEEAVEHGPAVVAECGRHELVRPEPVWHVHLEPLAQWLPNALRIQYIFRAVYYGISCALPSGTQSTGSPACQSPIETPCRTHRTSAVGKTSPQNGGHSLRGSWKMKEDIFNHPLL